MKHTFITVLSIVLVSLFISCNNAPQSIAEEPSVIEAKKKVDSLHHITMGKLEPVIVKRMNLEKEIRNLAKLEDDKNDSLLNVMKEQSTTLRQINKRMSTWMKEYKGDSIFENKIKAISYYRLELTKLKSLDRNMDEALK